MHQGLRISIGVIVVLAIFAHAQASNQASNFGGVAENNEGSLITSVIDRTITYQGILKSNTGTPVPDNTYNITFRIYKQLSGGTALWTSSSIPVITTGGLFSTQLGPISLPFDTTYYISIEVAGDVEMSRQMMTMSPYSASSDTANYAKASAGENKWVFRITNTADTTLITGGNWGIARNGNVLYGNADSTHVNLGIACTTGTSGNNYMYSTVSGGFGNTAGGYSSVIGGGFYNTASRGYSAISGGFYNIADGMNSVIGGGEHNTASGNSSAIGGGSSDTVKAIYGGIASGYSNLAGDDYADTGAFVGGGYDNSAIAEFSSVSGGRRNTASGIDATVGGGRDHTASGRSATVGGGNYNTASGDLATVTGGYWNTASGSSATISGGNQNTASIFIATVGGGYGNTASGAGATVGGGIYNNASGFYSTIGGGENDTAKATYSGVASGYSNLAGDNYADTGAFIGGGVSNKAIAKHATVTGGWGNLASGMQSTIGGGERDTASNQWSTVAGGAHNIAGGFAAMIPGGSDNVAAGNRSFAAGLGAHANHDGSFVWADDSPVSFFSDRDQQVKFRAGGGVKFNVNASRWVEFYDDGVDRLINVSNNAYLSRGGTWTNASDRNLKENFRQIDGTELLQKISQLSIMRWNYRSENQSITHIGPVAQDFNTLFNVGNDTTAISTVDPAGVALAGVQELIKQIDELKIKNEQLERRLKELENR
jgi:hypothetical protein